MSAYDNNAYFWQKVDTIFLSSHVNIIRHKGETHPHFKNLVYPTEYGHLEETGNGDPISVYVGTKNHSEITGMIVAADILQKTIDIKILVGCTEDEVTDVLHFLNQTDFQKTVLIRRGNEMPSWAYSDN